MDIQRIMEKKEKDLPILDDAQKMDFVGEMWARFTYTCLAIKFTHMFEDKIINEKTYFNLIERIIKAR